MGNCDSRILVQNIEGFCEISFENKVFIGEVESEASKAFVLINAVDDGKPTINVRTGINDIIISSDTGAKVFPVKMRILGFNGAIFKIIVIQESKQKDQYEGFRNENIVEDCTIEFCSVVDVLGTPSQLQEIASRFIIQAVDGAVNPSLKLEVVAFDEDFGDGSQVTVQIIPGGEVALFTESIYFFGSIVVVKKLQLFGDESTLKICSKDVTNHHHY